MKALEPAMIGIAPLLRPTNLHHLNQGANNEINQHKLKTILIRHIAQSGDALVQWWMAHKQALESSTHTP